MLADHAEINIAFILSELNLTQSQHSYASVFTKLRVSLYFHYTLYF